MPGYTFTPLIYENIFIKSKKVKMNKLLMLVLFTVSAMAGNAQIKKISPVIANNKALNLNNDAFRKQRLQQYANSFTSPTVTRNIGGINVKYTAKKNPATTDNVTTNTQAAGSTADNDFNCTTSRESVTATSSSFLSISQTGEGIYPGAIYTYNDFMMGNTLKTVGDGKRNPITIYTNNVTNSSGDVKVTVNSPSASAIYDATKSIVRNFSTNVTSATEIGQYTYSENSASLALNITAGGAYAGFSAGAGFSLNKVDHHIYITYDYKIPLYSLSTEIPTTGFFTDQAIEQTPNLVLISNVLYGTRILANIDIDESSFSTGASAKFKYGDPDKTGFKLDADFLMKNSNIKYKINTYVVGTAASGLSAPTTIQELNAFVNSVIRNTSYQTAKPIGYTLATMSGEVVGIESATDSYVVKNCVPKDAVYYLTGAKITLGSGGDNKDAGAGLSVLVYPIAGGSNWGDFYRLDNYTAELAKYSWWSQNLNKSKTFKNFTLDQYKQNGIEVDVVYNSQGGPFPLTDAWALDNVFVELEFRDQNGNIAPQAVPPIKWEKINMKLTKRSKIYFKTDTYFRPLAPVPGTY